jgi:hypothetical protein
VVLTLAGEISLRPDDLGHSALETREGSWCAVRVRLILSCGAASGVGALRRFVMADLAYALLLIGGFAVLLLTLRGLQRL